MTFKKRSHGREEAVPIDGQITACRRNSCAKVSRRGVWCIKKLKEEQYGYKTVNKVWDMKKKKGLFLKGKQGRIKDSSFSGSDIGMDLLIQRKLWENREEFVLFTLNLSY